MPYKFNPLTGNLDLVNNSSGGSSAYTGNSPTTVTVGGLSAGTNISSQTLSQVLSSIVAPYVAPSFASFTMSGQSTIVEIGSTVSGTKSFAFSFNTPANVQASTFVVRDVTNAVDLVTGGSITSPISAAIGTISKTTVATHSWQGKATNTNATVFSSSNFTIAWYYASFAGHSANATLTAAQIQALGTTYYTNTYSQTSAFPAGTGDYKYFCFPDAYGSPTASTGFKDTSNGLPVSMCTVTDNASYSNVQNGWYYMLVSVTNAYGITTNYRVYRTLNTLNGAITIQVS